MKITGTYWVREIICDNDAKKYPMWSGGGRVTQRELQAEEGGSVEACAEAD